MVAVNGAPDSQLRIELLGPVRAWLGGRELALGPPLRRAVLAVLALRANHTVPRDEIIDAVWGDTPPASAANNVQIYVSAIRRMLASGVDGGTAVAQILRGDRSGYLLRLEPGQLDVAEFEDHLRRARSGQAGGEREAAVRALDAALALWRGTPLPDVAGPFADAQRRWLGERRLAALEDRAEAVLELGRSGDRELVTELAALAEEHPLRERLRGLLMRALHHEGRRAEALAVYTETRRLLVEELGIEPGPQLREVHQAILTGHGSRSPQPVEPRWRPTVVPRQLPGPVRHFTGRAGELEALDELADQAATGGGTVVISAITGTAGVGKTTLAVHLAHRVADRFPDGQLYVNLRGFDPVGQVMDPAEAVRRFLHALGVPSQMIPADLDAQAALYRSQLAGRRMLILLDNARDTAQIRALLPAASTCLVLVTSRNQLTGLVVDGAHPVPLNLLTGTEAGNLLRHRLGDPRMDAEPQAVEKIITYCARLPLALAVMAARAATRSQLPLTVLAGELREAHDRLDALAGDDPHSDVRAVFSWSYRALSPGAARLFRLFGLHSGPDISTPTAASLAALAMAEVRPLLAELTHASLIIEHTSGRYALHDLLHAYAAEQARTHDSETDRHAATHRLLDHYLHTAHTADGLMDPIRDPIALNPPRPGVTPEHVTDHQQALAWFTIEYPALLSAVDHAAATGFDTHTWQLAWTLWTFLLRRGHWHDWVATGRAAVAAAGRLADPLAQARSHHTLANAYLQMSRFDDAHTQLRYALDLYRRAGDQTGQAHTYHNLSHIHEQWGQPDQARDHARQALDRYRAGGHRRGQAIALNAIGWYHTLLGEHREAIASCQQALVLHQDLGNRAGQAAAWDSLGYAHHHLGHHTWAITCYQHALALYQDLSSRYGEADTLTHLGDTHHAAGNATSARDAWQQALTILHDLGHPGADAVQAKLNPEPGRAVMGDRSTPGTP
jgi:DNA-binding SARP family transcriptional activator